MVAGTELAALDFNHNVNRSQVIHRFIVLLSHTYSLVIHVQTIIFSISLSFLFVVVVVVVYFAVVIIYINGKLTKILYTTIYAWYIGVFCLFVLFGLVCTSTGYVSVSL